MYCDQACFVDISYVSAGNISCIGSIDPKGCEGTTVFLCRDHALKTYISLCTHTHTHAHTYTHISDNCGSKCRFVHGAAVVIIIVASVLLLIKFFQLFSLRFIRYFKDLSSFIAPVLYLGAIIFSCTFNTPCLCIPDWQWQIGVITIFAGWISLLFYLRRLPVLGIYVVMFFNICQNSLKVLCVLSILVVGCGLALNMLFYNDQHVGVSWGV